MMSITPDQRDSAAPGPGLSSRNQPIATAPHPSATTTTSTRTTTTNHDSAAAAATRASNGTTKRRRFNFVGVDDRLYTWVCSMEDVSALLGDAHDVTPDLGASPPAPHRESRPRLERYRIGRFLGRVWRWAVNIRLQHRMGRDAFLAYQDEGRVTVARPFPLIDFDELSFSRVARASSSSGLSLTSASIMQFRREVAAMAAEGTARDGAKGGGRRGGGFSLEGRSSIHLR
ncbi:hypothetical protein DFH27DRAFT_644909 [Peziza echinospora]|nr:hypothetical protein DFH27DRAFT_644909 [Peziza echinospora]